MYIAILLLLLCTCALGHPRRRVEYDIAYPYRGPISWSEASEACIVNKNRDAARDGIDTSWRLASYADSRELSALQSLSQLQTFTPCWIGLKQDAGEHSYTFEDHTEGFSTSSHSDVDQCVYMARHATTNNATFGVRACSSGDAQQGSDDQATLPAIRKACCGRVSGGADDDDLYNDGFDDGSDAPIVLDDTHDDHDDIFNDHGDSLHTHSADDGDDHGDDVLEVHDEDDSADDHTHESDDHDDHHSDDGDDHTHDTPLMIGDDHTHYLLSNNRTARLQHLEEHASSHGHDGGDDGGDDHGDDHHHHHRHRHKHKHNDDLHVHTDDTGSFAHSHANDGEHAHSDDEARVTAADITDDHSALSLMGSLFSSTPEPVTHDHDTDDHGHDTDDHGHHDTDDSSDGHHGHHGHHGHRHRHKHRSDDDSDSDDSRDSSSNDSDDGHSHHRHNDDGGHHRHSDDGGHRHKHDSDDVHHHGPDHSHHRSSDDSDDSKDSSHHQHRHSHSRHDSDSYEPETSHHAHRTHHAPHRQHHHHEVTPRHRHRVEHYHTPRHHAHHVSDHRHRHPAYHAHSLPRSVPHDDIDSYDSEDFLDYGSDLEEPEPYDSYEDPYVDPYSASDSIDISDESYEDSQDVYMAHPWHRHHAHGTMFHGHHSADDYSHHHDDHGHHHDDDHDSDDDHDDKGTDSKALVQALTMFASSLGAVATHDHMHVAHAAGDIDSWAFLLGHPYYLAVFMFALAGGFMYYGW